jgi:hypothetical protein
MIFHILLHAVGIYSIILGGLTWYDARTTNNPDYFIVSTLMIFGGIGLTLI